MSHYLKPYSKLFFFYLLVKKRDTENNGLRDRLAKMAVDTDARIDKYDMNFFCFGFFTMNYVLLCEILYVDYLSTFQVDRFFKRHNLLCSKYS